MWCFPLDAQQRPRRAPWRNTWPKRFVRGRITLDDHEISVLADRDRADLTLAAEKDRTVQSRNLNGLHARKSRLDQQLDLAVIGESRDRSKQADRVGSRHQESTASDEGALEFHVSTQQLVRGRVPPGLTA
jgi:hypothetical protein